MFVSIRGRSCGVANIRNMFLKFARKAYSYCFRNIFVSIARYSYWWQGIGSDRKTFVSILIIRKGFTRNSANWLLSNRKLRKKFASIHNHLKGLTFSVILLGNRIISGEFATNINFLHSQGFSPQCESSILFATPHERPRMLTNTYECLAITLWSLRSLRIGVELHS